MLIKFIIPSSTKRLMAYWVWGSMLLSRILIDTVLLTGRMIMVNLISLLNIVLIASFVCMMLHEWVIINIERCNRLLCRLVL